MVQLRNLYFGSANGDTESNNPMFENLFYKGNNKYKLIRYDKNKFIVSGQKGTGKTIMGRYIDRACKNEKINCKILRKNDLLIHKLIELENIDLQKDDYSAFYIWFILREISKIIINTKCVIDKSLKLSMYKRVIVKCKYIFYKLKLKKFFKIRYEGEQNFQVNSQSVGSGGEATPNKIFKLVRSFNSTKSKKAFYKVIEPVKKWVYECLRYNSVILIMDDLDEIDASKKLDKEASILIIALINAIKDINDDINYIVDSGSKVILLIRTDILDTVNKYSSNLAKIRSDAEVNLYWIDKMNEPTQHMLMQMILHKIKQTVSEFSDKDDDFIYGRLFPDHIDKKDMVTYLIDYSFGRPRDIITYLNIILDKYPDRDRFLPSMFSECRKQYSLAFKRELYNELCIHKEREYTDEVFQLLTDYGTRTFNIGQIRYFYDKNKAAYPHIESIEEFLNTCYKFGILGNSKKNTSKKKNAPKYLYSWSYRDDGNENANFNMSFTVHFALRKSLSL